MLARNLPQRELAVSVLGRANAPMFSLVPQRGMQPLPHHIHQDRVVGVEVPSFHDLDVEVLRADGRRRQS